MSLLSAVEVILMDRDDQNTGDLDLERFHDAVTDIDPECSFNEIEHIFDRIADPEASTVAISSFIEFMDTALRRHCASSPPMDGLQTPTTALHAAFPELFADRNGLKTRIIWGDAQTKALHKLLLEFQEEAENEGVIDFPEFLSAANNMGIAVDKKEMERAFDLALRRQNEDGLQDEVRMSFLLQMLEQRMKRHSEHSKPRMLIKLALADLVEESNPKAS